MMLAYFLSYILVGNIAWL